MSERILTDRLLLSPLRIEDTAAVFHIREPIEVYTQFRSGAWHNLDQAEEWIKDTISTPRNFIFTVSLRNPSNATDQINGSNQTNQPTKQVNNHPNGLQNPPKILGVLGLNRFGTLFYMFHPSTWSNGYCTEALLAFLPALFTAQPDRQFVSALILEGNERSQRVLEKCGFIAWDRWLKIRRGGEDPGPKKDDESSRTKKHKKEVYKVDGESEILEQEEIKWMKGSPAPPEFEEPQFREFTKQEDEELRTAISSLDLQFRGLLGNVNRSFGSSDKRSMLRFHYEKPVDEKKSEEE